jgi:RNA polymerase sigma-70 factor (ECF subfamily)
VGEKNLGKNRFTEANCLSAILSCNLWPAQLVKECRKGKAWMPTDDSSVLERFQAGNLEAFEALFRSHQKEVYGWLLRIVRIPAQAEDLTAETFWKIYRARERFDPARDFSAWARTIATRAALDWLRTQRTETELPATVPAPPAGDPGVAAETRRKIAAALARLPPALRVAAVLAVVEEMPHKQVAEALGISSGAAKVRVFRALRILRRELQREGIEP